jgi:hypothetical protein
LRRFLSPRFCVSQCAQGYASRPNQTLLSTIVSGTITVYVNNRNIGTFTEAVTKRDISRYVRPGPNTLRVVLKPGTNKKRFNVDGVPNCYVKIAYGQRKNECKNLTNVLFGGAMLGARHKYDYRATFTIDSFTTGAAGARTNSNRTRPTPVDAVTCHALITLCSQSTPQAMSASLSMAGWWRLSPIL